MSTPKYFNARDWGSLLTREQILFLSDLTNKIQGVEANASADQTAAEIVALYNSEVEEVTQAEAEAGTETTVRRWTAQRVRQAIDAANDETLHWIM